jgi:hypothetical protein
MEWNVFHLATWQIITGLVAAGVSIFFPNSGNSPDDIVNCISELRRKREDEMVVVNWHFILHKLLAQDGATEQVLSKVKDLGADIMVIVEQEANLLTGRPRTVCYTCTCSEW